MALLVPAAALCPPSSSGGGSILIPISRRAVRGQQLQAESRRTEVRRKRQGSSLRLDDNSSPPQQQQLGLDRGSLRTTDILQVEEVATRVQRSPDIDTALQDWDGFLTSRALVAVLKNLGRWDKALQFFNWAKTHQDRCGINVFVYNVLLRLLRDGDQWEMSDQLLIEMVDGKNLVPDSRGFTYFVSCSKRCGRANEALDWFYKLDRAGANFDGATYCAMIDLCAHAGKLDEAMELYRAMRLKNYVPGVYAFGNLASLHAKAGDFKQIKNLFLDMEDMGVEPNVVLYNNLLDALSKSGRVRRARAEFSEMLRRGMQPTELTLCIMVHMYSTVGALDCVYELYQEMKAKKWKCDVRIYNTLLRSCADTGNVEAAEEMMKEMEESGQSADHMTYGILMNVYASRGMVDKARELLDKSSAPKPVLYTMLLKACKQAKEFHRIPGVFDEMITSGCEVSERLSGMLLACATAAPLESDRDAIIDCLKVASPGLYRLLDMLLKQDGDVSKEMADFLAENVPLLSRKPLCNLLIGFCLSRGRRKLGHQVLEAGLAAGVYPGLHTKLPTIWQINLRTLSTQAAEVALESWIEKLRRSVEQGEELPDELMVETGSGKPGTSSKLGDMAQAMLSKLQSPFEEGSKPSGFLMASGPMVKRWLETKAATLEA